jgi:L-amino acid N-acyltransferase YncA
MSPEHWPKVRRIYLEGITTGHASFETEAPSWEEWDSGHLPACSAAFSFNRILRTRRSVDSASRHLS